MIACSRGGRPGSFHHMNDVSVYLGRQKGKGSPDQVNKFRASVLSFEPGTLCFCFANIRNSITWDRNNYKASSLFLQWGTLSSPSLLLLQSLSPPLPFPLFLPLPLVYISHLSLSFSPSLLLYLPSPNLPPLWLDLRSGAKSLRKRRTSWD